MVIGNWSLVDWWIDQLILCRSTFYIDICFIVLDTRNNFMVLRCFWTPDKFASFVATNLLLSLATRSFWIAAIIIDDVARAAEGV